MGNYRILQLIAVVLVVSLFSVYAFADEENENNYRNEEHIEETQIDESLNQSLIDYLESLEDQELSPSENGVSPEYYSDEDFIRDLCLDEAERNQNSTPKEGWRTQLVIWFILEKMGGCSYCGMTRAKLDIDPDDQVEILGSRFTDTSALSSGNGYYVFPYVTDYGGTMYPGGGEYYGDRRRYMYCSD